MRFSDVALKHGLFLAPLAGYTDYAFRTIARRCGAEYLTSEMVSAKAICFKDKSTLPLARVSADELPCAVQIFGHEPDIMARAAALVAGGVDGGVIPTAIDINMGCPVHKIAGNGDGSALMKDPHLAEQIIRAVKDAVSLPVTVKMRVGWDAQHINAVEVAKAVEAGGADMICVHGRTKTQGYSGTADYTVIADVKRAVSVPVVGNGDVTDAASARRLLDTTDCDGIMIGRGAVGNPFVFREIAAMLDGKPYTPPTNEEKFQTAMEQLTLAIADKGDTIALLESRKQLSGYLAGIRGGAAHRSALVTATSKEEVEQILYTALLESK